MWKVTVENSTLKTTNIGDDPIITYNGVVDDIAFVNCKITGSGNGSQCVALDSRSDGIARYCKKITFTNCDINDIKLLYRSAYTGTDVTTELNLVNVSVTNTNRLIENLANYNLIVKYSNVTVVGALNQLFRFTTGKN